MKTRLYTFLLLIILGIGHHTLIYGQDLPQFVEDKNPVIDIPKDQKFTFGYLHVPENRNTPNSQTIKLPVYIFKSRSAQPKPDPIIYTVGGPGRSTMPSAAYMNYYQYLDQRDFILIEQRGTKYAQPALDCPQWAEAIQQSHHPSLTSQQKEALLEAAATVCQFQLRSQGIDLNGYRTTQIAADIEDLRKVLGIEQYNLLTISYSTKIAQVLMRDYPKAIRSVVMDSPLPLEVNYDMESVGNLNDTYAKIFKYCAADSACHRAFPDLSARFFNYLFQKTTAPLYVKVKDPKTNLEIEVPLKGRDMISLHSDFSTNNNPNLPFQIENTLTGNQQFLKDQVANWLGK